MDNSGGVIVDPIDTESITNNSVPFNTLIDDIRMWIQNNPVLFTLIIVGIVLLISMFVWLKIRKAKRVTAY